VEGNKMRLQLIEMMIGETERVVTEDGFRYDEELSLSKLEKEKTEKIIRKKNGEKVQTLWQKMTTEEKENRYFDLRINAFNTERDRLTSIYPDRSFVVRIIK
jgi:hypothetical protein